MKYFLLYLFLEVLVSVNISTSLGALLSFVAIVFTAFIGVSILVNFRKILSENLSVVSLNRMDMHEVHSLNLFPLLGAFLLIVPGFLTDLLGLVMQFSLISSMIVNRYGVKSKAYTKQTQKEKKHTLKDSDVIDVEIISDNTTIK